MLKRALVFLGAFAAGRYLSGFLIKEDDSDTTGFIPRQPGFGLDELAEGLAMWGAYEAIRHFVGKKKGA